MEKNKIIELGKICSSNSILVATKVGVFRLFCPFKATVIKEVATYVIGDSVTVISVKMDKDFKLMYIIQNKGYYHHYFMITSNPTNCQTTFN